MAPERRRLAGKRALITGSAGGIGAAIAGIFAEEGARLALLDRDGDRLARLAGPLGATAIAGDIGRADDAPRILAEAVAALGGLDVLVNNAAARTISPLATESPAAWRNVLDVNIAGTAALTAAALPSLRRAGRASIVNVASCFAIVGRTGWGAYDASKAAIVSLTRTLAAEEAAHGIRANAVLPGSTLTPWTLGRAASRGMTEAELRRHGFAPCWLGRWAEAREIAWPVLWLASDEASFVTGIALPVDGGLSAG